MVEIVEVYPLKAVAESSLEIAAVGPREVQACVGDGGSAKSSYISLETEIKFARKAKSSHLRSAVDPVIFGIINPISELSL